MRWWTSYTESKHVQGCARETSPLYTLKLHVFVGFESVPVLFSCGHGGLGSASGMPAASTHGVERVEDYVIFVCTRPVQVLLSGLLVQL